MDSLSVSSYRNFEQQTLRQNGVLAKEPAYKKSVNFTYPEKKSEEIRFISKIANIFDEPVSNEEQKLNLLV